MKAHALIGGLAGLFLSASLLHAAEVQTALGPVEVEGVPQKIAVYDIAALDTLNRLGVEAAGVPANILLPDLREAFKDAEPVGDLFEPDLEALNALEPDLVIVGGRSSRKLEAVTQVAPSIDMTIRGDDLVSLAKERLATYGALFDKTAEAEAAAAELDAAVEAARKAVDGKGTALLVMTNGPKVTTFGPGSRFGWIYEATGLKVAESQIKSADHGEAISFEFIRNANPDWLLVLDRSAAIGANEAAASATLDNELVGATTAWQKQQVVYLPASDVYIASGGVQATQRILETITSAFTKTQ